MDLPLYGRVLWKYRLLLVVGLLLAALAGTFAGFTISDGQLTARGTDTYKARATLMLGTPELSPFATQTEPQPLPTAKAQQPTAAVQRNDLSSLALVYAYLVTGNDVRSVIEATHGPIGPDEEVTAVRRTTQPAGDERFPGRASLPIIDVVATSTTEAGATALAQDTAKAFETYVTDKQRAQKVPADRRVQVSVLRDAVADPTTASSPALPVALVFLAVLMLFVALAFMLQNISLHRTPARSAASGPERPVRRDAAVPAPTAREPVRTLSEHEHAGSGAAGSRTT